MSVDSIIAQLAEKQITLWKIRENEKHLSNDFFSASQSKHNGAPNLAPESKTKNQTGLDFKMK